MVSKGSPVALEVSVEQRPLAVLLRNGALATAGTLDGISTRNDLARTPLHEHLGREHLSGPNLPPRQRRGALPVLNDHLARKPRQVIRQDVKMSQLFNLLEYASMLGETARDVVPR